MNVKSLQKFTHINGKVNLPWNSLRPLTLFICMIKKHFIFKINTIMLLSKYISLFQHFLNIYISSNCVIED